MSNDYVFDIETYPNVFTLAVEHAEAPLHRSLAHRVVCRPS